jgi:hypothetical protein
MLTLKRASKSRPSGQWSDNNYGVFDGEQHVGRIMLTPAAAIYSFLTNTAHGDWAYLVLRGGS